MIYILVITYAHFFKLLLSYKWTYLKVCSNRICRLDKRYPLVCIGAKP